MEEVFSIFDLVTFQMKEALLSITSQVYVYF